MILPQERQLGAEVRSGWRWAWQVHFLRAGEAVLVEERVRVGFVWSSRARMAESRSVRVVEAPRGEGPEGRVTLAGAGEEVREGLGVRAFGWGAGRSDVRGPEADGGSLERWGKLFASGSALRARMFERGGSLLLLPVFLVGPPAM